MGEIGTHSDTGHVRTPRHNTIHMITYPQVVLFSDNHYHTHNHAVELAQMAPESPIADRQAFLSYAYNLDAHALDIKSIVELLIEHDRASNKGRLETDHLRGALAAHYGGMVTMCVACHNRFRQTVIP